MIIPKLNRTEENDSSSQVPTAREPRAPPHTAFSIFLWED